MMRIASEFGFTPASRSRISTATADEPNLLDLMQEDGGDEEAAAGKWH
jgi:phage terminase small subunit